jgi:hypothetical protein
MKARIAVLTGDIVLSERATKAVRKSIPAILGLAADGLRGAGLSVSGMDVFRGDGWQMIVRHPSEALRVALYLRAYCRASPLETDTRVAIGLGEVEGEITDPVSTTFGSAFTISGRTLDSMPRNRRMQLARDDEYGPPVDAAFLDSTFLDASLHLLDRIVGQWTAAQARVTAASLLGGSQEDIGAGWTPRPISQQAVAQHLRRSSWHAVSQFIDAYADLINRFEKS